MRLFYRCAEYAGSRWPGRVRWWAFVLGVLFCTGLCQAVPDGYTVSRGALHIHTVYSDGSGTYPEVTEAARQAGVDFIVVSDHDTLQALRDGHEGWHDGVLTLVGVEITTDVGHYLVMDVPADFTWPGRDAQGVIDAVRAAGGLGFIAHPIIRTPWRDWSVTGVTGMEIVNQSSLVHRYFSNDPVVAIDLAVRTIVSKSSTELLQYVTQTRLNDKMARWQQEIRARGRMVAIGSVDAHALLGLGFTRLYLPSYKDSFSTIQTHVITPQPFSGDIAVDRVAVYDALRQGHCYVVYALRGDALGFWFAADNGTRTAIMGDELSLNTGVTLAVTLPPGSVADQLTLYRNGIALAISTEAAWRTHITTPGIYHVEVTRLVDSQRVPWITSNPIYVTDDNLSAYLGVLD